MIVNVAKKAKISEQEIDNAIKFYGEDELDEEVLGFLRRLKRYL